VRTRSRRSRRSSGRRGTSNGPSLTKEAERVTTELVGRIVDAFRPEKIILFGSRAYGRPTLESDIDLLVILSFQGSSVRKAVEILSRIDARVPVDLVVRTPQEVRQRLAWNDFFLREVMDNGKVLYEAPHA
jgi:predicted nucleotidyltransferase